MGPFVAGDVAGLGLASRQCGSARPGLPDIYRVMTAGLWETKMRKAIKGK